MRLDVRLPEVQPAQYTIPTVCLYTGCKGSKFHRHGQGQRQVEDLDHPTVTYYRYRCTHCGRTFRVYPEGINQAHQSHRLKAMSVLLYVLGLSYLSFVQT